MIPLCLQHGPSRTNVLYMLASKARLACNGVSTNASVFLSFEVLVTSAKNRYQQVLISDLISLSFWRTQRQDPTEAIHVCAPRAVRFARSLLFHEREKPFLQSKQNKRKDIDKHNSQKFTNSVLFSKTAQLQPEKQLSLPRVLLFDRIVHLLTLSRKQTTQQNENSQN